MTSLPPPPLATFPPAEYESRLQRTRDRLRSCGLDALLLFSQESLFYLTGYDTSGYVFFQCGVLPVEGEITLLTRRPDVEARIVDMFVRMGRKAEDVQDVNRAQADLPEGCTVVPNTRGTASGMWFEREGRVFLSMPGVPYEMKGIMADHALGMLNERFRPPVIVHRTVLTAGLGESLLAQRIEAWEDGLAAKGIKLAYLPSPGLVKLRLSAYAKADAGAARALVDHEAQALYGLIPELIFGEGEETLEQVVGRALKERKQTLSLAESCTGGLLAGRLTEVAGDALRDGQALVDRQVTFASLEDRQPGLGARDDPCPTVHRRDEGVLGVRVPTGERRDATVEAVVVDHVGAAAQHDLDARAGERAEDLDAALRDYADQGFTCCAVNFESFNPEAALFWPRYFDPVCYSLTRIPETA